MEDLVSIIVPVYNAEKYIEETIKSIENQTYKNYEAIFIDDLSTDNSLKIIESHAEENERFKIIKFKEHKGVSSARNIGINEAKGKFLTFLDADDVWSKYKLEKQVKFIKNTNSSFTYCSFKYISDDGSLISKKIKIRKKLDYKLALKDCRILTITTMIDLSKIEKNLCYMPDIMSEDIATWWNILKNGNIAIGQDEVLAYYRKTKKSRSSNKIKNAYYRWLVYKKIEKLNFWKSIYFFSNYAINAVLKRISKMKLNINNEDLEVAISTMNLNSNEDVDALIKKMNIKGNYLIINQVSGNEINITNKRCITKYEKGLSKSRNEVIKNSKSNIILFADDDVVYDDNYQEKIISEYQNNPKADIICFYVKSLNPKRKTKKFIFKKSKYLNSLRAVSFEITFKMGKIKEKQIYFDEQYGANSEIDRGEEQIFLYEAIHKGLNVKFINKKIGIAKQEKSTWYKEIDEQFLYEQRKIFERLSPKYCNLIGLQYLVRKYKMYRKNVGFFKAKKIMIKLKKEKSNLK